MIVTALSLQGVNLKCLDSYFNDVSTLAKKLNPRLMVLPAHTATVLGYGTKNITATVSEPTADLLENSSRHTWIEQYLELHCKLAKSLDIYLAAGTLIEEKENQLYNSAYCLNPAGEIYAVQRQTHLTRFEHEAGLSRGETLEIFDCEGFKTGLVVGNDARHPEVGRIFGLRDADLLLHCGAQEGKLTCWSQTAGMWSQVQQNQFWAVEAQLSAVIVDKVYGGASAVIGPCEITPGQSGYLARGYPHSSVVTAQLDQEARKQIKQEYPLLKLLNPEAYRMLQ
ncbi:MAG: carbon-nitrogen hydrolase family protein [Bacillota bacterium]